MKKTNTIEINDIGTLNLYPIKAEQKEFTMCNSEFKPLKKEVDEKGKTTKYKYVDSEGKKYTKDEVGYKVGNNFIQKVKRTEKVVSFKVVDKADIFGNLLSDGYFIADGTDTTIKALESKIQDDKAIEFVYKSSSIGLKWRKGYIYKFQNCFVMSMGLGFITDGVEEYMKQKLAVKQLEDLQEVVVTKSAEELEKEIFA
jgi:hypothetical protein